MFEKERANTPEQKKKVIERLEKLWLRHPELRLGQLIQHVFEQAQISIIEIPKNGKRSETHVHAMEIFYIEDFPFIEELEAAYVEMGKNKVD